METETMVCSHLGLHMNKNQDKTQRKHTAYLNTSILHH